ncbi:major facilitator superfamily domain-containing protein [Aspergillus pseudodeflectus]|uniref:Major facilitator superfamily domain-containing protein n=1 Tax=Aspergillus pseudodeflectus TaxID=176178 RepID=A0ABR4L691_9EURO
MWFYYQYRRIRKAVEEPLKDRLPPPAGTLLESANEECQDSHVESHPDELVTELHSHDHVGDIDAHRWYKATKWMSTLVLCLILTTVAFATAISAGVVTPVSKEFGVPEEVDVLATAMFLWGFGTGSLVTGPFSETCGRTPVFVVTLALFMVCIALAGSARGLAQQVIFRFLAGFFGSIPWVCAGGSISDLWTSEERVYIFPVCAVISFVGSTIAPVAGGYLTRNNISWRWGDWITVIATGVCLFIVVLCLPETFRPILLKVKTRVIHARTQAELFHKLTIVTGGSPTLGRQLIQGLYRPFILAIYEPIVLLFTWYIALIYIVLFTSLNGYTFVFGNIYGFDPAQVGLCFLPMLVGNSCVLLLIPYANTLYRRDLDHARGRAKQHNENNDRKHAEDSQYIDMDSVTPPPESHLYYAMFGAPFIPIALFCMAYTARPEVSHWYLMACYGIWSASALATVNFLRSMFSGGMMMASMPMYKNIGVMWSLTIMAIAAAVMTPVPYAFYWWGPVVRRWSRHADKGT